MADALLKLLNEKPMEEITISEITDTADVARVTFYRHFNSKEDLLYFKCKLMGERWNNSLTDKQRSDPVFLAESFFQMTDSMKELLLTLHHANLHHIVLLAVHQEMRHPIYLKHFYFIILTLHYFLHLLLLFQKALSIQGIQLPLQSSQAPVNIAEGNASVS